MKQEDAQDRKGQTNLFKEESGQGEDASVKIKDSLVRDVSSSV